jgi:hypothetical protein
MMMFHAPLVAFFLILVATSAAVVGSMIVLAMLDWIFGKNSTPSLVADIVESDLPTSPVELNGPLSGSKPKIERLGAPSGDYRTKRKASPGYGPQTQRVIHLEQSVSGHNFLSDG